MKYLLKVSGVSGKKLIYRNLERLGNELNLMLHPALLYGAELLRDKAIENVKNWSQAPGLSMDGQSLIEPQNWSISREVDNQVKIQCNSKHAMIVEFGGTSIIKSTGPGFPVGKQQHGSAIIGSSDPFVGKPVISKKIKMQQPMAYFRSAIDTPSVKTGIHNRIATRLSRDLKGIF